VNKEQFAPWERGFDSDRVLRHASRFGEYTIKPRPASQPDPNLPTPYKPVPHTVILRTRSQWFLRGRRLRVPDSEATKVVVNKAGFPIYLFSEEQTVKR
jgi:hypothetical protein